MNNSLEQRIRGRVRRIYYMRRVLHPVLLKLYGMGALAVVGISLVSFPDIMVNVGALHSLSAFAVYLTSAFVGTETGVQLLLVLLSVLGVWFLSDLARALAADMSKFRSPSFG